MINAQYKQERLFMTSVQHTPAFTENEASDFILKIYGCKGSAKPLPSERDQNFHITAETGEQYVLKIANALEARGFLEAQNQAMTRLSDRTAFSPEVILSLDNEPLAEVSSKNGIRHFTRMVSFIPGMPLGDVKRHSDDLLQSIGSCLGQIDGAFADFDHPATHRDFHWDLANALDVVRKYNSLIEDPELKKLIKRFADRFEQDVVPLFPRLRKSVIHNDANDYNVIVGGGADVYTLNQEVVGIIDFGDMVYSYTVCEPAIAMAYAVLDKPDPLAAAVHIINGYHKAYPLDENEIAVLYDLVCMRLCVSACLAAHQIKARPDNKYLAISQQPIQNTLPRLAQIHPGFARAAFRHACGFLPSAAAESVSKWLGRQTGSFAPVLGDKIDPESSVVFDLGIGSPLVNGDPEGNEEPQLTKRLYRVMEAAGAKLGIGQYNEPRLLYTTPMFDTAGDASGESRTIHTGIDLFAPPETPVYAPISGIVHAFGNNRAHLDYGPMIILAHRTDSNETFYTLYGHLSQDSVDGLHRGDTFRRGDRIASIGAPPVNGGWTPHLHFQIITDLFALDRDFPGVCRSSQRAVWCALSPDPNIILNLPKNLFPEPKPDKTGTLSTRKRIIGKSLSIGYRNPLKIERGWMQYLYDDTGRRYLDAYNNVPHLGHCHPRVIEAARQQMAVLNTNTRYLHDTLNRYAERLAATMPDPLSVCFFVNSASEGNELALRLARAYTDQKNMIVLEGAYHGHTNTLIDISPYKHDGPGGTGAPSWVHTAPVADLYRGRYRGDDPEAASKYARHILTITEAVKEKGEGVCGFIAESCPSVGGQIIFPEGYLAHVYGYVREAGGVCIADEVQTGYGRTGSHFYAYEAQGVVPDIVILGKPIGNGHPISAVVTTPDIAEAFDNGMEFFSTFGGNTVSSAVGLTVLEVALEEDLQAHALKVGSYLLDRLDTLKDRFPIVGDVRGSGLFLGIELVKDRETLEPAGQEASFVADRMRESGVLLGTDGPFHNVVKIRPPMPFSESDADLLAGTMEKILEQDFS
jgi:4-aminobutyrate aminotransferase-like enzyme/Ser/Thr protein kinase RdoA (MazF antagonist)